MARVISELKCSRCGYRWFPRGPKQPGHCPNPRCNSPYWNRPRRRKKPTQTIMPKAKTLTGSLRPPHPVALGLVEGIESPEMAWLEENARKLGQHPGEWLLIQGRKLLVHSRDFAALRKTIQEQQISSPFVYYVPTNEESNAVTI